MGEKIMEAEVLKLIKEKFGKRATDSKFECALYTRDLAPVPAILVDPMFKTMPDLVVRPENSEEVSEILRLANDRGIPVTPRAGASTVYFDTVPAKGGIVMDLNLIKGIVGLDETKMTVTVKAGTTWGELEHCLRPRGLAPLAVPSSAPAASLGGWFCMMGYGIGSLKYGSMLSQVREIEVVLPNGDIRRVTADTDPPLTWFASSEGTLGIVTLLEVGIRRERAMKHFLLHSREFDETAKVLAEIKDADVTPYNLHFTDEPCVKEMHKQGFSPDNIDAGCLLAVDFDGTEEELNKAQEMISDLVARNGKVSLLPEAAADREWEERYKLLRLKRGGPSELGGEVWLPINELAGYLSDIRKLAARYHIDMCSYGHVVTPERVCVMTMFFADETKTFAYILNLSLVKKIQDVGYRHGGYPYGVGLWNTPYLNRIFPVPQLAGMRDWKKTLDPRGIMNPGKLYKWPLMLNPFNFSIGMNLMAVLRLFVGGGARG